MTAGSTSQQALGARRPKLLPFAALVVCGALAVPASAAAFDPQPDPPAYIAPAERISATHVTDSRNAAIRDEENKLLGGPDTKLLGGPDTKLLGGPDT